jgi:hypothetical protein
LLSSQKARCVTHVSGMNCHPSLRKGTAERVLAAIEDVNQQPVVHTWTYKLESAA